MDAKTDGSEGAKRTEDIVSVEVECVKFDIGVVLEKYQQYVKCAKSEETQTLSRPKFQEDLKPLRRLDHVCGDRWN